MLNETKIETTDCIKIVAECIQNLNDSINLEITANTFAAFDPILGFDYF
jgi:hypothetical protein